MSAGIMIIASVLLAAQPLSSHRVCTTQEVYADPVTTIGCEVSMKGRVKKIVNVTMPMEFIIESDGYLFLIQYFMTGGTALVNVREGKRCRITGTILGSKQLVYEGSVIRIPSIYCTAIE